MDFLEEENKETLKTRIASTSHIWKISAVLFVIGFILHIISFGTPFWIVLRDVSNSTNIGIWNRCTSISSCEMRNDNTGWLISYHVKLALNVIHVYKANLSTNI